MYLLFGALYVVGASLAAHPGASSASLRAAVGFELLANIAFIATALALFVLLHRVNEPAALAMVLIVAVASAVGCAEAVIEYAGHMVASPPGVAETSSLFSGLWLIPLGFLVLRSRYFPTIVGALLLIAAASWLLQFFLYFFAPAVSINATVFGAGAVGELVFIAWLLIFSARPPSSGRAGLQA